MFTNSQLNDPLQSLSPARRPPRLHPTLSTKRHSSSLMNSFLFVLVALHHRRRRYLLLQEAPCHVLISNQAFLSSGKASSRIQVPLLNPASVQQRWFRNKAGLMRSSALWEIYLVVIRSTRRNPPLWSSGKSVNPSLTSSLGAVLTSNVTFICLIGSLFCLFMYSLFVQYLFHLCIWVCREYAVTHAGIPIEQIFLIWSLLIVVALLVTCSVGELAVQCSGQIQGCCRSHPGPVGLRLGSLLTDGTAVTRLMCNSASCIWPTQGQNNVLNLMSISPEDWLF